MHRAIAASFTLTCALFAQSEGSSPVVAVVGDHKIKQSDLDSLLQNRPLRQRQDEYNLRRSFLEGQISSELISQEAARRGTTPSQLIQQEVNAKVAEITDQEAKAVYDTAPDRYRNMPEATAIPQIKSNLLAIRLGRERTAFVAKLRAATPVSLLLDPPRVRFDDLSGPAVGPVDAKVQVVVFSEFQCPFCSQLRPSLDALRKRFPEEIRIVFRHFPLNMHADARKASEAAACAADQGKFWEMHDLLFQNQKDLAVASLKGYSQRLGLDPAAFNTCLDSGGKAPIVQRDVAEGMKNGVESTPTVFINGRPYLGAQPVDTFAQAISEETVRLKARASLGLQ